MRFHIKSSVFRLITATVFASVALLVFPQEQPKAAADWQIEGMAAALEDPIPEVRRYALEKLNNNEGDYVDWRTFPSSKVVPFLRDPDSRTRVAAVSALGAIQAKEQAGELVKLLKNPDSEIRQAAITALGAMQAKEQAGELVKLLKNPDSEIRQAAITALGAMQAKEQAGELVKLLQNSDSNIRRAAITALGAIQAKEQAGELVKFLRDSDPEIREAAIVELGAVQAKEQAGEIVKLLKDPNAQIRRHAITTLAEIQAKEQAGEIAKLLRDKDVVIRAYAISALGAMQAKEQAGEIVKQLKDPDSGILLSAITALGEMQAREQAGEIVKLLKDPSAEIRRHAISALGAIQAREQVGEIVKLLKEPNVEIRSAAISALGEMQAKEQVGEIVKLLKDPDSDIRQAAVSALGRMQAKEQAGELLKLLKTESVVSLYEYIVSALKELAPFPRTILPPLSEAYYFSHEKQNEVRFLCYYLTGGDSSVKLLLRRIMFEVGTDQKPVAFASLEQASMALKLFHEVLPAKPTSSGFSRDAEEQILQIAREWRGRWSPADGALFSALKEQMSEDSVANLEAIIQTPWWEIALQKLWKIIAIQIVFWVLLLYFYPTSPTVQAFFFWNRWARKFFGLGYVDLCLTWIPLLRNRLLIPFHEELLADAQVKDQGTSEYFEDVQIREGDRCSPLKEAIAEVTGQIVLEGESGLGKSMFLRRLTGSAKEPIVYLPAGSCDQGVFEAIQIRLKGKAGDEAFLKSIIWSGGLRIVIDGLNEVTVETREKIRRFLEDFPKAHVLLATQPMLWKRPPKARVLMLLPLSDDRILAFLESRFGTFGASVGMSEPEYKAKCQVYVAEVLDSFQSEVERSSARLVLSNPMDLTTVAQILASGGEPTLKNLQEQQFARVNSEFKRTHQGQEFPLKQFCESVYARLLEDKLDLDSGQFFEEIQTMVNHKMVLVHNTIDKDGKGIQEWVFRHDKIRDYFLIQAFFHDLDKRIQDHIDDSRFRGVYLMLASRLPVTQARELKDVLVERAAETKDHHLSDAVVEVLKTRKAALGQSA